MEQVEPNGLLMLQVFQLKVDGVAFRLIPEPSQVKNAIKVKKFLTNLYSDSLVDNGNFV